jgi:hypothetical protein
VFVHLVQAAGAAKLRPSIIYDSANNALWIRIPKNSGARTSINWPCFQGYCVLQGCSMIISDWFPTQ